MNISYSLQDDTNGGESSAEKTVPTLFTMCTVNSYGSADLDSMKDDGKPLRISGI